MYLCLEGCAAAAALAAEPSKYSPVLQAACRDSGAILNRSSIRPRGVYPALSITFSAGRERGGTFKTAVLPIDFSRGEVSVSVSVCPRPFPPLLFTVPTVYSAYELVG